MQTVGIPHGIARHPKACPRSIRGRKFSLVKRAFPFHVGKKRKGAGCSMWYRLKILDSVGEADDDADRNSLDISVAFYSLFPHGFHV